MVSIVLLFLTWIVPIATEQTRNATRRAAPPKIGFLQNPEEFDGFGCLLQLPMDHKNQTNRIVFMSNSEDEALVNIDGDDVRLNRVAFDGGSARKGIHSVDRFRKGDITAEVEFIQTKRCIPNDENCDLTEFDAVITIVRGLGKRSVATKGVCGG